MYIKDINQDPASASVTVTVAAGDRANLANLAEAAETETSAETRGRAGGEESFVISRREWAQLNASLGYDPDSGLAVGPGMPVDENIYDALAAAAERTAALRAAARMLAASEQSAHALRRKLAARGISPEAAEAALRRLREKGYLNEESAALRYAEAALRSKHYGPRRILAALLARGYGREEAEAAVGALDPEEVRDALRIQIEKKRPALTGRADRRAREKAVASLMRLGFSGGEIRDALRETEDK